MGSCTGFFINPRVKSSPAVVGSTLGVIVLRIYELDEEEEDEVAKPDQLESPAAAKGKQVVHRVS